MRSRFTVAQDDGTAHAEVDKLMRYAVILFRRFEMTTYYGTMSTDNKHIGDEMLQTLWWRMCALVRAWLGRDIRAIVFDLGGVLVEDSRRVVFAHISAVLGVPVEVLERIMYQETPRLQRGEESTLEFWYRMCDRLKVQRPSDEVLLTLLTEPYTAQSVRPIAPTLDLVRELKRNGYRIGVISNTIPEHIAIHHIQGVFVHFDFVALSYVLRMRKPEGRIFSHTARQLGVNVKNMLFHDNEMRWVRAARESGCQSLLFTDAHQARLEMRKLGVNI